jgi:hypothetical protein
MKRTFTASISKLFAGGILFGFFAGCSALDPAEDIPSYLHIDAMTLNITNSAQGSSSAKITDAWIFMDGDLLGAFELPCNVPILAEGTHHFIIRGGVKMNGLISTRAIYPSWKGWEGSVNLVRGQSTVASPVVTYFPGIDFLSTWMLDFDLQGTSLIPEATSSGVIVKDTIPYAYEGPHSGYVHLNNVDTTFFVGASSVGYLMPPTVDTWVEFDYWSDAPFTVGIKETVTGYSKPWLEVQPNYQWTKIYVRLTDALAEAATVNSAHSPASTPYKIYFAMINPTSQAESHLYIDNIKLLK